jgi:hypothetical protein
MALIHQVLELARWAPSGDNTQPWRFEIRSDDAVDIHGYDTRQTCVYDLDGHASQLSHGALLENVDVAASRFGARADWSIVSERAGHIIYRVKLERDAARSTEHPLAAFITQRSVQRRAMRATPLTDDAQLALRQSVPGYELVLMGGHRERIAMATLNARNAQIRLTIPEAYDVHKAVIAWNCRTSDDRIPDASLGAGPVLLATMKFAMASWPRVDFFNRYMGGTLLPRLMLDFLPGVLCSSHFALIAPAEPSNTLDRVGAGRALQRLWLTATSVGLQMQPSYTPLVFARYAREGRPFTRIAGIDAQARDVARRLDELLGGRAARAVFLGRLGPARGKATTRSTRLPLERLIAGTTPTP